MVVCIDVSKDVLNIIIFFGFDDINIYNVDVSWFSVVDKGIVYDFLIISYNIINVYGELVELFNIGFFNMVFM